AVGALNDTVTVPVVVFCVIVFDTPLQLLLNTLFPPFAKAKGVLKLPVVIVSVIVKLLAPAGTVTFTQ
ncbi:MAG: hypothetical protein DME79_00175, partial [Verrucomicrobia bacterium]